jgi:hypothetical protein
MCVVPGGGGGLHRYEATQPGLIEAHEATLAQNRQLVSVITEPPRPTPLCDGS